MKKKQRANKNKIVDLWHHKRQQVKNKRRRNLLRRLGFILLIILFNGSLVALAHKLSSPDFSSSIEIQGLLRIKPEKIIQTIHPELFNEANWLLKINKHSLGERIKKYNPLISAVEVKAILWPDDPHLRIHLKEELPWARFSNGWLLTSTGRLIGKTDALNFNDLSFASQALLISNDKEFAFWSRQGKNIQKLIYSVSSQFPEMPVKSIVLKKGEPVILHFPSLEVSLGYWDSQILERASRLSSANTIMEKYQNHVAKLDLSDNTKAKLELKIN